MKDKSGDDDNLKLGLQRFPCMHSTQKPILIFVSTVCTGMIVDYAYLVLRSPAKKI